jgi:hypothetical protein
VVLTKLVENSTTHGSRFEDSTTLDKLAWENSWGSSSEAEKTGDQTPHASKIAFYVFSGPGHVMGDELLVCASLFFIKRRHAARRVRLSFLIKAGVSPI